jgi:hypothetical protein
VNLLKWRGLVLRQVAVQAVANKRAGPPPANEVVLAASWTVEDEQPRVCRDDYRDDYKEQLGVKQIGQLKSDEDEHRAERKRAKNDAAEEPKPSPVAAPRGVQGSSRHVCTIQHAEGAGLGDCLRARRLLPVSLSPVSPIGEPDNLTGWSPRGAPTLPVRCACQGRRFLTSQGHSEKRVDSVSLSRAQEQCLTGCGGADASNLHGASTRGLVSQNIEQPEWYTPAEHRR